jgi:8-oxo-dGTP diphosphatase
MSNFEPQSLPKKHMGAGILLRNTDGEALIVVPTYKSKLEIPGGIIEAFESPKTCAIRETHEELGLEIPIGRLLVLDYLSADIGDSLQFIFDGGIISDTQIMQIKLPEAELSSFQFVARADLASVLIQRMARRVEMAFMALETNQTLYLEHGFIPLF